MIITKTPFRASFAGGGTDLPAFYEKEDGMVVSMAINSFVYLAVHRFFENRIVLKYSETESVEHVDQIRHGLIRECLKIVGVSEPLEITSFADIPSRGSGLGSSSAFAVGLISALQAFKGLPVSPERSAHLACEVEIGRLGEPIGKQDQYAAAYGGLNTITFRADGTVNVEPITLEDEARRHMEEHLVMFYTGLVRSASEILSEQKKATESDKDKFALLRDMKSLAVHLRDELQKGHVDRLGPLMHEGWLMKKGLAAKISLPEIDAAYEAAMQAGATGGKLLGAGGGGFLLFYCPPSKRAELMRRLAPLRAVPIRMELRGSRVAFLES
ncbi:MAG: kinase [Verrucomicrobiales bacterium]|nr:kinase [Verrucomicrobiales bacterium]